MKKSNTKKLALAGVLCAVAVVGSMFSFPVFGSKCAPVQHMVNVLCAVLLGPWYGVGAAFVASLLRNLLGLGSLMAFPGSMCGALLCGVVYHKTHKLLPTLIGEVCGTGIIGGLLAWPVAILFMGKAAGDIAFYAYIVPFLVSTVGGSIIAGIILFALELPLETPGAITVFILLQGVLYGFGLWWVMYLYVWYLLALLAWLLRRMDNAFFWAVFSGLYGLCFGGLCAAVYLFAKTPAFALSWWLSGLSYDALHGVGNFVLMLLLYRPLCRALQMAKKQLRV